MTPHFPTRLAILLMTSALLTGLRAQTGIFASSPSFTSPTVGVTSFDGTTQQAFVQGASNEGGLLTTDGNHLYRVGYLGIWRTHLISRVTERLATFQPGQLNIAGLTTDGHRLFIVDDNSNRILEYTLNGSFKRIVATATSYVTGLITDGEYLYWSDEEDGLFRRKIDGTQTTKLLDTFQAFGLSANSTHLYWADGSIRRCDLNGGNPQVLVDLREVFGDTLPGGDSPNYFTKGLTVTDTHVYWAVLGTYRGIYRCGLDGSNPIRLTNIDYSGESSLLAYPNALFPEPMAPVRPTLDFVTASHTATLTWPSIPARRYQLLKSEDLANFTPSVDLITSSSTASSMTFASPAPRAFFLIRKLPGQVPP